MSINLRGDYLAITVIGAHLTAYLLVWLTGSNEALFYWLNSLLSYLPDTFWQVTTHFGETLTAAAILLLFVRKYPVLLPHLLISGLCCFALVYGLKQFLDVTRPHLVLPIESFHFIETNKTTPARPSGHTATGTFIAATLVYLFKDKYQITLPLIAAGCIVALSRVAIGVHWPLDLFMGGTIGWITGYSGLHMIRKLAAPYLALCKEGSRSFILLYCMSTVLVISLLVLMSWPYPEPTFWFKSVLIVMLTVTTIRLMRPGVSSTP